MGYEFQEQLIQQTIDLLKTHERVILSACVGAGKTHMANKIMSNFRRVLVLAHGQDILRKQFGEESMKMHSLVYIIDSSRDFFKTQTKKKEYL